MYKCLECGHLFEEGEQTSWEEDRGEYWGSPCSEKMYGCPNCRGNFEKTVSCKICGKKCLKDKLINDVCEECINKNKENIDLCFEIAESENEKIELNCFLTSVFTKDEIEEILLERLKLSKKISHKLNFDDFVNQDKSWFAERMIEVLKDDKK